MSKSNRHIARCMALQAIYSEKLNPQGTKLAKQYLNSSNEKMYKVADGELLDFILNNALEHFDEMLRLYSSYLSRDIEDINLIEKSILVIAAVEFKFNLKVPAVVIINEAIELSKTYGSNDSYKFINSLVEKLGLELRKNELAK